jgi:hypothetical protein
VHAVTGLRGRESVIQLIKEVIMTKNGKLILAGVAGALGGYFAGALAGTAKLISIGDATWKGSAKVFGLPVMYIDANSQGFIARTEWGVFVLALAGALFAILFAATRKTNTSK